MKILHIIASTGVGGAEKHLLDLCRLQQASGLDIAVALPAEGELAAALKKQGTACYLSRAGGRWNPWALWSLRRLIRQIDPDLVHAHMLKSAAMVGRANRSVPCVATAHNIVKHIGPFRFCRHVICVSDMVRDSLSRRGYPPSRSSVVYNAVDMHTFGTDKRDSIRSQLGWQDKLVVLCVARLVPAKGQQYAIEAMAQLAAQLPGLYLVLAGSGPDRDKLTRLSSVLGVSDRVDFLGTRHDVPDLLAACDMYLQPSLKEGFCIAFLEAMATGLPCIGTQTGAIPAMLDSGVNGLLITPGDSLAIAEAIGAIAADGDRALRFARAARTAARSRFSPDKQTVDTIEVYRRVLSGR
ncbi:MAG: glycosyltransferase [Burkholderiales bacterium]